MRENIVLIGFMGSGKSTIGARVAKNLGRYLIDTDLLISSQNSQSIKSIFETYGEEYFRKLEAHFIHWAKDNIQQAVIATGGGMPVFNPIKAMGKVFYLKVAFETITNRLNSAELASRPLFANFEKAFELYKNRQKIYENVADIIINANNSIEETTLEILKHTL